MNMRDLQQTKRIVEKLLRYEPQTRNSDSLLYLRVIGEVAGGKLLNPSDVMEMPLAEFLLNHRTLGYPPFESVRRARQKLQHEFPELKACEKVEAERVNNIKYYRSM